MAGSVIGIELELNAKGAITSARRLGDGLDQVKQAGHGAKTGMDQFDDAATNVTNESERMVQGLQMAQRALTGIATGITSVLESSLDSYAEHEVGLNNIEVVMGKIGDRAQLPGLVKDFDLIEERIQKLGRETEFTTRDIEDAFTNLLQSGLSAKEALSAIDSTQAFSSASAGAVELEEAADLATNAMAVLQTGAEGTGHTMDMLIRLTNKSKLSMTEMNQVMRGLGATATTFKDTAPADILATVGALRTMGTTAGRSAQMVRGLSRTIPQVLKGLESGNGDKFKALTALGIEKGDFINELTGEMNTLPDLIDNITGKMQKSMDEGMSQADVGMNLFKGMDARAVEMFQKQLQFMKNKGMKSFNEFAQGIEAADGDAKAAQANFLNTVTGKGNILSSTIDLLKIAVGKLVKSFVVPVLDFATPLLNVITSLITANPILAKAFIGLTVAVAALAAILAVGIGAMAGAQGAMMILGPTGAVAGGGFSFAAAGAALFETALLPLLAAITPVLLAMSAIVAATALVALAYRENFGGLKDFIDGWVTDVVHAWELIRGVISGKGVSTERWDEMSDTAKDLGKTFTVAWHLAKEWVDGFKSSFLPVMGVVGSVLGWLVEKVLGFVDAIAEMLGYVEFSKGMLENMGGILKWLGAVLGVVVGVMLVLAAAMLVVGVLGAVMVLWPLLLVAAIIALVVWVWNLRNTLWGTVDAWTGGFFDILDVTIAVVAGVAALFLGIPALIIGAIVLIVKKIYDHWAKITQFFSGLGTTIKDAFISAATAVWVGIQGVWNLVKGGFLAYKDWVVSFWGGVIDLMLSPDTWFGAGMSIMESIRKGIMAGVESVKGAMGEAVSSVREFLPFSPAKAGPLRNNPPDEAGGNIMEMLADGMRSAKAPVDQAISGVTSHIQAQISGVADSGGGSVPGFWADLLGDFPSASDGLGISAFTGQGPAEPARAESPMRVLEQTSVENSSSNSSELRSEAHTVSVTVPIQIDNLRVDPSSLDDKGLDDLVELLSERLGDKIRDKVEGMNLG